MKKLILSKALLILLLLTTATYSQKDNYIGFGVALDVKNALIGSPPTNNNPELNYQLQLIMVSEDLELTVGYEGFPRLQYNSYTLGVGYHFRMYAYTKHRELKTTFIPSVQYTMINRYGTWGSGISYNETSAHLSIGVNLAFRWNLNSKISVEYCYNMLLRADSKSAYGEIASKGKFNIDGVPIIGSNFIKVIWRVDITKTKE